MVLLALGFSAVSGCSKKAFTRSLHLNWDFTASRTGRKQQILITLSNRLTVETCKNSTELCTVPLSMSKTYLDCKEK